MRRVITLFAGAVLALGGVLAVTAAPAAASTQTVGFRAGSWHCPQYGVYDVVHVSVSGTSSAPYANADQSFPAGTQTAYTAINGIPSGGGQVWVTITYRCKVKILWWYDAGPGEPASDYRWVYGSGTQPVYTL